MFFSVLCGFWGRLGGHFWRYFGKKEVWGGKGGTLDSERQYHVFATFSRFEAPWKVTKCDKTGGRKSMQKRMRKYIVSDLLFSDFEVPLGVHLGSSGHPKSGN